MNNIRPSRASNPYDLSQTDAISTSTFYPTARREDERGFRIVLQQLSREILNYPQTFTSMEGYCLQMTILLRNNQQHLRIDDLRYRAFAYLNSTYCRIAPNSNEPFRYTWDARRALSDEALSSIRSYITEIVSALTPTINRLGHIPLYQHMEAHLCLLADYINPVTNQNLVAQARLLATADCPQYGPYLTQFRQAIYTNAALLERPLSQ